MPLNPIVLLDRMQLLVDEPPPDEPTSILEHAAAFRAYMEGLINPAVLPGGHDVAEEAFVAVAQGQSLPPPIGILAVQTAYVAYVTALAALTAPFVTVPPPGPPALAAALSLESYVGIVDLWVRTGTASVPPAPPIPWA